MTTAHGLRFNRFVLLLMMTIYATRTTIVPTEFKKLEAGHSITGTVGAELRTRSKIQCSDRLISVLLEQFNSSHQK